MIITCPECATDYSVNADAFPVTGRTVKCARCAQTWYALPVEEHPSEAVSDEAVAEETDDVAATDAIAGAAVESGSPVTAEDEDVTWPEPAEEGDGEGAVSQTGDDIDELGWEDSAEEASDPPADGSYDIAVVEEPVEEPVMTADDVFGPTGGTDDFSEPVTDIETEAEDGEADEEIDGEADGASFVDDGEDGVGEEASDAGAENVVSIEAASRARRAAMRFKSRLRRKEPVPMAQRAKSMAVGGMLAMLAAGIIYREDVVRSVPSMAGLYALAGFEINLRGLTFEELHPVQEMAQGLPVLRVKGGIRNVTQEAIAIPPVRLSLTSSSGQEIYFWTIQPEAKMLAPGETAGFSSVLSAPPRAATGIAARFVDPEAVRIGLNGQ